MAQNDRSGKEEKTKRIDLKCSRACDYLFQKVNGLNAEWQRYQTNKSVLKYISKKRLVVHSPDVILFSSELDHQTLLFTRLHFDWEGHLKEIKYFFYGPFSSLHSEYLKIKEKIEKRIGRNSRTDSYGGKMESIWTIGDIKAVFIFEKESVSRNGVISLVVHQVITGQKNNVELPDSLRRVFEKKDNSLAKTDESYFSKPKPINESKKEKNSTPLEPLEGATRTVRKKTSVRSEGRDKAPVLFRIDVDDTFVILKSEYNYYWTKVRCKNREGWVKTSLIK